MRYFIAWAEHDRPISTNMPASGQLLPEHLLHSRKVTTNVLPKVTGYTFGRLQIAICTFVGFGCCWHGFVTHPVKTQT